MSVNKVVVGDEVKLDLSADSVTPQTLLAGATAHDASGEPIEGAVAVTEISRQTVILSSGGWSAGTDYAYTQTATVEGMTAETEFDYDASLTGTDAEGDAATLEAFAAVQYASGQAGSVVFKATEQPTVNLPVIVRTFT